MVGNWEKVLIGDCFDFKNGLNKAKEFFGKGTPIINYTDVYKKRGLNKDDITGRVTLSSEEIHRFLVVKNDVFFTRTSETPEEVGFASVLLEDIDDCVFSGFVLKAHPKNDKFFPPFCKYCFMTAEVRDAIIKSCTYTTRALTNGRQLSKIEISLPPFSEQQRIAEALSDVDIMISSLEKLIEKKKAIKQGMMEQLLTGKARLPGFEGEWNENWTKTSIGSLLKERIVSIQTGPFGTVLKAEEYSDHGIPVISVREIREGYIRIFDDTPTISLQVYNRLNQYVLEPYDLVFARKGSIDRSAIIPKDGQKYFLGSDGIRLRFNSEILSQFMLYLFQSIEIKRFLSDNSYGTTMAGLNETTIKMIPIYYPTNHSIRNKIVDIITDITKETEKNRREADKAARVKSQYSFTSIVW